MAWEIWLNWKLGSYFRKNLMWMSPYTSKLIVSHAQCTGALSWCWKSANCCKNLRTKVFWLPVYMYDDSDTPEVFNAFSPLSWRDSDTYATGAQVVILLFIVWWLIPLISCARRGRSRHTFSWKDTYKTNDIFSYFSLLREIAVWCQCPARTPQW